MAATVGKAITNKLTDALNKAKKQSSVNITNLKKTSTMIEKDKPAEKV